MSKAITAKEVKEYVTEKALNYFGGDVKIYCRKYRIIKIKIRIYENYEKEVWISEGVCKYMCDVFSVIDYNVAKAFQQISKEISKQYL